MGDHNAQRTVENKRAISYSNRCRSIREIVRSRASSASGPFLSLGWCTRASSGVSSLRFLGERFFLTGAGILKSQERGQSTAAVLGSRPPGTATSTQFITCSNLFNVGKLRRNWRSSGGTYPCFRFALLHIGCRYRYSYVRQG